MLRLVATGAIILGLTLGAEAAPAMMSDTGIGSVLTDDQGMTLYIFDKDEAGTSNCTGQCAVNWPPFLAEADAMADGDMSLVERSDGTMQWAHDGMPLYYWKNDLQPGDTSGDGVGGVWHVVTGE